MKIIDRHKLYNNLNLKSSFKFVKNYRKEIINILNGNSKKFLIIIGPCSVDNPRYVKFFFKKLNKIKKKYKKHIFFIARLYLEKPRTIIGWKGLIYDPDLNFKNNINLGIKKSVILFKDITRMKYPIATEFLSNILYKFTYNFVSVGTIGARNYESQIHREFCSSLNFPIGFKNGTSGDLQGAINSIISCSKNHFFLSLNKKNDLVFKKSKGNKNCFIILRGSLKKPNYKDFKSVDISLIESGINKGIIIDASHDNSNKKSSNQKKVIIDICKKVIKKKNKVVGIMMESYLEEGNQNFSKKLKPGLSITDECMSFENSLFCIKKIYKALKIRFNSL